MGGLCADGLSVPSVADVAANPWTAGVTDTVAPRLDELSSFFTNHMGGKWLDHSPRARYGSRIRRSLACLRGGQVTSGIHSLTDAVRLSTVGSVANGWVHVSTVGRNHGTVQAATVACGSEND